MPRPNDVPLLRDLFPLQRHVGQQRGLRRQAQVIPLEEPQRRHQRSDGDASSNPERQAEAVGEREQRMGPARQEVLSLVSVFRAKVVDICDSGLIIETTGNWDKVNALLELLKPLGVVEIVRTGVVAMARLSERGFDEEVFAEEIAVSN